MSQSPQDFESGAQQSASGRNKINFEALFKERYRLSLQHLTQQQLTGIELMLRGLSDAQVAAELQVDRGTVYRWRKLPQFGHQLELHRRKMIEQSTARLQTMLDPALDILQKQLEGTDPKTALRAAAILVRLATPSRLLRPIKSKPPRNPVTQALDDYINAPMPDGTIAEHTPIPDDDEEDDLDFDEE